MTATDKPKAPGLLDGKFSPTRPLAASGNLFAFALDVVRALPKRPFQVREFIQQAWFVASVTILPTALVAIPFGAVIALQIGSLTRQLGAQSFTGAASVLAVLREASPIVTALLIAGAGGSAICADLGARKIRDEIDAMEVLGIDPIQRLVVPAGAGLDAGRRPAQRPGQRRRRRRRLLLQRHPPGRHARRLPGLLHRPRPARGPLVGRDQGADLRADRRHRRLLQGAARRGGPKGVGDAVNQSVVITFMLLFVVNFVITAIYFQLVPPKGQ